MKINIIDSLLNLACIKTPKDQKSVVWNVLDFVLRLFYTLESFIKQQNIPEQLRELIDTSLFKLESAEKLREYWDNLKGKEKSDHSKSCQMVTEIQVSLMRLER